MIMSRIWEKKEDKYANPSARFTSQQFFLSKIHGEIFYLIYRDLYKDAMLVPIDPDGHQNGGRKPTQTSVTEFR